MKRRLRIATMSLMAASGPAVAVAAPASPAAPTTKPFEAPCAAQGGQFSGSAPTASLFCTGTGEFSDARLRAARAVCERALPGLFSPRDRTDFEHRCIVGVG